MKRTKKYYLKTLAITMTMIFSMQLSVAAAEKTSDNGIKTVEVSMEDVIDTYAANEETKMLAKDSGRLFNQTGTVTSVGQFVDFSNVLPADARVVSVTLYCPTSVKVSQGKFTAINSFLMSNGNESASVKFLKTDRPTAECRTTALAGSPASTKWFVQIQGRVISNYTGMDGFTVYGGCKMIIEYE